MLDQLNTFLKATLPTLPALRFNLTWHHWRRIIRSHVASSGATKGFILVFFFTCVAELKTYKHALICNFQVSALSRDTVAFQPCAGRGRVGRAHRLCPDL